MDELQHTREALIKEGSSTTAVDNLVARIAAVNSAKEAQALLNLLEPAANKLAWPFGRDYAALALQQASAKAAPGIAREMLEFALARAQWCASCATSGGEGLARSTHVRELESLLRSHGN